MYCRHCGSSNPDRREQCQNCGAPLQLAPPAQPPQPVQPVQYGQPAPLTYQPQIDIPNYLVQSILVTLFCCLPFGIVSIVYAAQVNSHVLSGNYQAAVDASNKAKTWCLVSFLVGVIPSLLGMLVICARAA